MKPLLAVVGACVLLNGSTFGFAFQAQDSTQSQDSKPTRVTVTVTTQDGEPIADAFVELRSWEGSGKWYVTSHQGKTDIQGKISFQGVAPEKYMTALAAAEGFATVIQDFQLVVDEPHRKITCKLGRPAASWIQVTAPDGAPLAGAEIARLEVVDANGTQFVVTASGAKLLDPNLGTSDAEGRLMLPLLPKNATASVTIVHSDWASSRVENFKIINGKVGTASLHKGTRITASFRFPDGANSLPAKHQISLRAHGNSIFAKDGKTVGKRFIHDVGVIDRKAKFTLHKGSYQSMQFDLEGHQVTPVVRPWFYHQQITNNGPEFDFSDNPREFEFIVRRKIPVTGRVVLADGKPVEGVFVMADTENLVAESSASTFKGVTKWVSSDACRTDKNGRYNVQLPAGKARISIVFSNHYTDTEENVFEVVDEDRAALPDVQIKPMPLLKGVVRNSKGEPVPGCVVRDLDGDQMSGNSNYYVTNDEGEFSFQISQFPFDTKTKKIGYVSNLMAMDPTSDQGAAAQIDLRNPDIFGHIELTLEPKPIDWFCQSSTGRVRTDNGILETQRKKFPRGKPGNVVDDLSRGTWLNSDATSLKDFHGKYVLLDFWFIGCGPCERDLPSVNLAQQLFADRGFTVVSVHISTQTVDNVRQYAVANRMNYPVVVDNAKQEILKEFELQGVTSYPTYLLLGPDGKILENDAVGGSLRNPSLRSFKLEVIHRYLNEARNR